MTRTEWHAGPELLALYSSGELDYAAQAAVETHLSRCPGCRADAVTLVQPVELQSAWDGISATLATSRLPGPLRLLARVGVPETDLIILRTSANVLVPLVLATTLVICFAVVSSWMKTGYQELFYLAVAPLLPALLIASAYDTTDTMRNLTEPTPFSKLRIALLRTTIAVAGALPLVVLMGWVPNIDASLAAWLLPALALAVVSLTLLTWFSGLVTMSAVSGVWLTAVAALYASGPLPEVVGPWGQLVSAAVLLVALAVFANRAGLTGLNGVRP